MTTSLIPLVVGNWKMNTTHTTAVELAKTIAEGAADIGGVDVVVCPPFVSLKAVGDAVAGGSIMVGAQNLHYESDGAFTGEISAQMLADLCEYVIIGHSERFTKELGETNETVCLKTAATLRNGLCPVICVGEQLIERQEGLTEETIDRQLRAALEMVDTSNFTGRLVVAYEPVWAIGGAEAATPQIVEQVLGGVIRPILADVLGVGVAAATPLLYGGSVTANNAGDFAGCDEINGVLVGGASLNAGAFLAIAKAFSSGPAISVPARPGAPSSSEALGGLGDGSGLTTEQIAVRELLRVSLLPVISELDNAIQYLTRQSEGVEDQNPSQSPYSSWSEGLQIIQDKLEDFQSWEQIVRVGQLGELFDPDRHHAIGTDERAEYGSRCVVEIMRPGYMVEDRVVQKAEVIINR